MSNKRRQFPELTTKLERAPHVAWRDCGDELVILELRARRALGLDSFGARVWELLDGSRDLATVVDQIAAHGKDAAAGLAQDVQALTSALLAQACLVVRGDPNLAEPASFDDDLSIAGIAWAENLEESGVFAGCAKDEGGSLGEQCRSTPSSFAS